MYIFVSIKIYIPILRLIPLIQVMYLYSIYNIFSLIKDRIHHQYVMCPFQATFSYGIPNDDGGTLQARL